MPDPDADSYETDIDGPEPWAQDPNVPTRQPAFCPYCGHDGAFDGTAPPVSNPFGGKEYRHRCPDCGYAFKTIEPGDKRD